MMWMMPSPVSQLRQTTKEVIFKGSTRTRSEQTVADLFDDPFNAFGGQESAQGITPHPSAASFS